MASVLQEFIQILVSGITQLAQGIASGVVQMSMYLFLDWDAPEPPATAPVIHGLSVFGGIVAIFAGLALAISITTRVYTWVTSLGN